MESLGPKGAWGLQALGPLEVAVGADLSGESGGGRAPQGVNVPLRLYIVWDQGTNSVPNPDF